MLRDSASTLASLSAVYAAEAERRESQYPKVLYHATLPQRVVNDAAEQMSANLPRK
jgi:hypothetical protein